MAGAKCGRELKNCFVLIAKFPELIGQARPLQSFRNTVDYTPERDLVKI